MQRYNINNRLAYLSGGVQSAGGMWPSVGGGWTPASATTSGGVSPVFWYNAGDIAGLNDNDAVTSWSDSAGSYDLTTTAGTITYKTSIVNGEPVARLNVGSIAYVGTQPITGTDPRTIFIVTEPDNTNATNYIFSLSGAAATGRFWAVTPEVAVRTSTYTWVSSTPASTSGFCIIVSRYSSGNLHAGASMRLDGADVSRTSGTDGTIDTATASITLGGYEQTGGGSLQNRFSGDIAEVVGYEAALSTTDIDEVEAYLASKYSITI